MASSVDVRLPRTTQPKFPDACIVCNGDDPDATIDVGDFHYGWASLITSVPRDWTAVSVPIHTRCRRPFRRSRWLMRLVVVLIVGGLYLLLRHSLEGFLQPIAGGFHRFATQALFAVMLALPEVFWPPCFDFSISRRSVTYSFSDYRYAAEFAQANGQDMRFLEIMAERLVTYIE